MNQYKTVCEKVLEQDENMTDDTLNAIIGAAEIDVELFSESMNDFS